MPPKVKTSVSLASAAVPLEAIRADGRSELLEILEMHPGNKLLVLDSTLGNLLSHVLIDANTIFDENGVTQITELGMDLTLLAKGGASLDFLHVLFLVRPSVEHCRLVAAQIASVQNLKGLAVERFNVYFAPHKSLLCEQLLEDEGVLDLCDLGEFRLDLIPLETDLLSLELDACFKENKLDGNGSSLQSVTQSVMKLQSFFGVVPNVKAIGPSARDVSQMMCRARVEEEATSDTATNATTSGSSKRPEPLIDTMVLIDREVDLVSPLVTPLTYEGLVDELIGIRNSIIRVSKDIVGGDDKEKAKEKAAAAEAKEKAPSTVSIALNSNDALFAEIRGLNIEKLFPFLGQKAKIIRGQYDQFRANKDASITEIHDFVKTIPGLKENYNSLNQHINITEELKRTTDSAAFRDRWNSERALLEGDQLFDMLEELIATQAPPVSVLRLLCLQSLTNGGIVSAKFDFLRREIVQTYGYEYLFTLTNLEKVGMLRRREVKWMDSGSPFATARRTLGLIDDAVNVMSPRDMAYVTSGYAPLSARLVQHCGKKGRSWAALHTSTLSLLPRPAMEFTQGATPALLNVKDAEARMARAAAAATGPGGAGAAAAMAPSSSLSASGGSADMGGVSGGGKPVMMVYYIGGVSWLEVQALRFLSNSSDFPYQIIICTTKLLNGNTLIKSLIHKWDA